MRHLSKILSLGTTAVLLARTGGALCQPSSIELVEVSASSRVRQAATSKSVERSSHDSPLRLAVRGQVGSFREAKHQFGHDRAGARGSGASSGMGCQSDVAEHRQERRGAASGNGSGSGRGAGGKGAAAG